MVGIVAIVGLLVVSNGTTGYIVADQAVEPAPVVNPDTATRIQNCIERRCAAIDPATTAFDECVISCVERPGKKKK